MTEAHEQGQRRRSWFTLLAVIPWVMMVMTVWVLLANVPSGEIVGEYTTQALIYLVLTAFTIFFAVWLTEGTLSPAHFVGLVAFLSLPKEARALSTWVVFWGGLLGTIALLAQYRQRVGMTWQARFTTIAMSTARLTISFYAASQIYITLGAALPVNTSLWQAHSTEWIALSLYMLVYLTLYIAVFLLELYVNGYEVGRIINENIALILTILLLPIPFAIISGELSSGLNQPSEVMSLVGIAVIVLGLHAISRSDQRTRRQLTEMTTLSIVTRAMRAHLDLQGLLRTIYLQISDLFLVTDFTLLMYTNGELKEALIIRDGEERRADDIAQLTDRALIDHVLARRTSLYIPQGVIERAVALGLNMPTTAAFTAWMGVPMVIGAGSYGVMAVASRISSRTFTQNDLRLLTIVADSASIAIENAQLFERQAERLARLSALNNIAAKLSGTLSPDVVFETIVNSGSVITEAKAAALYLYVEDDDEGPPQLVRTTGITGSYELVEFIPLSADGEPFSEKMPLPIPNTAQDERVASIREALIQEGILSLVELPLAIGDKPLGILTLYFGETQIYTMEGLELLRTFSTQAAQAISNARAYTTTDEAFQRSVEQLLTLAGIGRVLTSTIDLKQISELVLQHVMDATQATGGFALLTEHDTLKVMAQAIVQEEEQPFIDESVRVRGISKRAYESGQVQRVDDALREGGYAENPRLLEDTRAQLAVPILRGRDVLGVITVESDRIGGFSAEDSHFVAQIANQAVIAIDNARLFQRITEARDRLQVILDTMEEAILLIDNKGKIALANPRISMLDMTPAQLLNQTVESALANVELKLAERMGFADEMVFLKLVRNIGQENAWAEYPPHLYVYQAEDGGTRYLQRFVIPVLDDAAQTMGALLVFYDKTHEQELGRAREELTRMIVHDLRSPLTAVTTSLRLLQDYVPPENESYSLVQSTTQASRQAVRKLLGRVDSLLDIAKMQSGKLTIDQAPMALSAIAETVRDELRPLAEELDIHIQHEFAADLPALHIDHDKVERLLLNLLDNALKYSPTDNQIVVRAYAPGTHDAKGGYLRVDVIDNGPGVPDHYKQTLFDAYVQVDGRPNVRRGVGLGLSFCKMVAEAHGGSIWVEDNPSGGSIFSFTLPVVDAEHADETPEQA